MQVTCKSVVDATTTVDRVRRHLSAGLATAAIVLLAGGVATTASTVARDDGHRDCGLVVATTVAPITSIAANIGGDRVDITGIVPEGTNTHTFEPAAERGRAVSRPTSSSSTA